MVTQVRASHILVKNEDEAKKIKELIDNGKNFGELAKQNSTCPSGKKGGDLGWFSTDTMVAPFSDAVRIMEVGTFSEVPVATRFGWHVILLEDATEQAAPGLDNVRDEITSFVEQRRIQEFLEGLREGAEVIVGGVE